MAGAAQTARMVTRAPEVRNARPIRVPAAAARAAQAAVRVSQPTEPAEREAERVARRVVAMPSPATAPATAPAPASTPMARRMNALVPASPIPAALGVGSSSGRPLPRRVRRDMEPRFGADFSAVRVHTGDTAARASRRLNAAAFTVGRDVFFGRGRFQPESAPGRGLIAHELTHTIQQGAAAQPASVQRSVDTTVHERSAPRVQRLGIQDALDYFAEKAEFIPGFSMLALLLGFNPVSLRSVPRSAANLLRALIQLLPGGALITQALDNHGIVERVAAWAEGELSALGDIGSAIRQSIDTFLDGLGWSDIFDLGDVWERAKRIVTRPIEQIISFGSSLVSGIVAFIKDAILRPLAALVEPTRGYPLLKAVLGFDPVTGDAVPRNAVTLIGGFMTLIGQDEVWQNIQRGNAVGQAWAWFQGALAGLIGIVLQLPTNFLNAFRSLELIDIVLVPRALAKVFGVFVSFYGQLFSWGLGTVFGLLEIIISVVAPGALAYLRRAGAAFQTILRDPIGFCMNLVRAAKAGLQRFARNFLKHLTASLLNWLTDSLPGIHIPQSFSLPEIFKFVMSVLGLTWANLRVKLVREVGEPAVKAMEAGFAIVVTLVRDGPAAAWEQIKESLADLKRMAIDGILDMVVDFVVIRAIPKLVALFIPGPGFITAAILIYDTIVTFIRQLGRIAALVKGYIDAIVAIATGSIDTAAAAVEAQAARYMTLAITVIAGMAGFGKVSKRVQDVLERIRKPIDKAMDRVVGWIVGMARKVGRFVVGKATSALGPADVRTPQQKQAALTAAVTDAKRIDPGVGHRRVLAALDAIRIRHRLTALTGTVAGAGHLRVDAAINPQVTFELADYDDRMLESLHQGFTDASTKMLGMNAKSRTEANILEEFHKSIHRHYSGVVVSLTRRGDVFEVFAKPGGPLPAISLGRVNPKDGSTTVGDELALRLALNEGRRAIEALGNNASFPEAEEAFSRVVATRMPGAALQYKAVWAGSETYLTLGASERRYIGLILPPVSGGNLVVAERGYRVAAVRGPQHLLTTPASSAQFVLADKGLIVQRYIWRNVNGPERALLTDKREAVRPDLPSRAGDGTSSRPKATTPEPHVLHDKTASDFSSGTTASEGQIVQRKTGKPFSGSGRIKIDLFQIDPANIVVLTSRSGTSAFSFKTERAILDAAATREVLIKDGIPGVAIVDWLPD